MSCMGQKKEKRLYKNICVISVFGRRMMVRTVLWGSVVRKLLAATPTTSLVVI